VRAEDEIRDAAGVDTDWLTAVLACAGIGHGRSIRSVSARSIGTGQVGDNVRFQLDWSDGPAPVPPSVVVKFPSQSPVSRSTAVQVDTYRREVGFYRDIRPLVTIRTPDVHHVGWDPATHDFVLVMEDLSASEQGDQLSGCSVTCAESAVDEIVGLHAPTWGAVDELAHLDWLSFPSPDRTARMQALFEMTWPGFEQRYGGRLTSDERAIGRRLIDRYVELGALTGAWADGHAAWCVTHGDYRLDNILFAAADGAPPVVVVDWQTTAVGVGPADVAYFLGAGLTVDDRRRHERRLVARYVAALRRAGVDIDEAGVWEGYVLGTAGGYLMAVIASQIVEQTERGDDMFVTMATRHAAQIADTGLLDLL
jgi:hypothetical protein